MTRAAFVVSTRKRGDGKRLRALTGAVFCAPQLDNASEEANDFHSEHQLSLAAGNIRRSPPMHHRPRDQRVSLWVALALVLAFCAPPLASAEIFKCMEKNGMARLQNFPCAIDSLGSLPSGPPPASTTAGGANDTKPPAMPVAVGSADRPANASEPRVGMTENEVTAMWGEPSEIIQDEAWKNGRIEIWRYGDTRSVQFSNKHRVLAVQR